MVLLIGMARSLMLVYFFHLTRYAISGFLSFSDSLPKFGLLNAHDSLSLTGLLVIGDSLVRSGFI